MLDVITNPIHSLIHWLEMFLLFGGIFALIVTIAIVAIIPFAMKWFAIHLGKTIVIETSKAISTYLDSNPTASNVSDLSARINQINNRKAN